MVLSVSDQPVLDVAYDTIMLGKQALIFTESKLSAEKTAEDLARIIRKKQPRMEEHLALADKLLKSVGSPTKQCKRLSICVMSGVAFHHAGLVSEQRTLLENAFRDGTITTLCATPTLAYGVDTPAYRVILKSLKRYSGQWGMAWIPVLEYLQFCGRAGRPKFHDDHGEAIAIAKDDIEHDKIHAQYILGLPEDIASKLAVEPVLRTHILSLIASDFASSREQLILFFSRTFWAHQYKDMLQLEKIIDKMLALLVSWGFLLKNDDDFVSAADLGKNMLNATPLGKRVAELYLDPYTAHVMLKGVQKSGRAVPKVFGVLQLISHTLQMRPLLRLRVKDHEVVQQSLMEHYDELLVMEPTIYDPAYDEFLESIKTSMFFEDWMSEHTEEQLLEKHNVRPGEVQGKVATADWLLYALGEMLPFVHAHHLITEVKKLRMRMQYGVKEELLTLLRFDGVGRVRARRLFKHGLIDVPSLKKADVATLARIVGKATAAKIKEQVGQKSDAANLITQPFLA